MTQPRTFYIGTRGSLLATTQSGHVRDGITAQGYAADLHIVHTPGDASQAAQTPVSRIGVGVFTETLRSALHARECDIAVHSFKDLPTAPDERFRTIVPPRADAREVLISRGNVPLMELPEAAKVGTGAPRRISQIKMHRPDLELVPVRGNITTRMDRINQDLDAVVLARAGLERAGLMGRAAESIAPELIMPAPAQGALSVEVRADDDQAYQAVIGLDHSPSHAQAIAERAILATLEAGCSAPVAGYSTLAMSADGRSATLTVFGGVYALDGTAHLVDSATVTLAFGETLTATDDTWAETAGIARGAGQTVGHALLEAGADRLMAASR